MKNHVYKIIVQKSGLPDQIESKSYVVIKSNIVYRIDRILHELIEMTFLDFIDTI
jgi:hypothetical protein